MVDESLTDSMDMLLWQFLFIVMLGDHCLLIINIDYINRYFYHHVCLFV